MNDGTREIIRGLLNNLNDIDVTFEIAERRNFASVAVYAADCSETNLLIKNNIIRGVIKRVFIHRETPRESPFVVAA